MGSPYRAKIMSDKFKNNTLKAVAFYVFDKCGNCVHRTHCAEEFLSHGGKEKPFKFIMVSMIDNCPETEGIDSTFVAREGANFLKGTCGKCDKFDKCLGYFADAGERSTPEEVLMVQEKMLKCVKCENLDKCLTVIMDDLGITKFSLLKEAFVLKFRICAKEDLQCVSSELPVDHQPTVLGDVQTK
jgi:hypothetical protein